jgi:hypothetical protein
LITMIKPYAHIKGGEIIYFLPTTAPVYMQFKSRLKARKKGLNPFNNLLKIRR